MRHQRKGRLPNQDLCSLEVLLCCVLPYVCPWLYAVTVPGTLLVLDAPYVGVLEYVLLLVVLP